MTSNYNRPLLLLLLHGNDDGADLLKEAIFSWRFFVCRCEGLISRRTSWRVLVVLGRSMPARSPKPLGTFDRLYALERTLIRTRSMSKVYIQRYSGILSAYGLSLADSVIDKQLPASCAYVASEKV